MEGERNENMTIEITSPLTLQITLLPFNVVFTKLLLFVYECFWRSMQSGAPLGDCLGYPYCETGSVCVTVKVTE